jgi:hypothetical protein
MDERERALADLDDPELSSYFYLDVPTEKLLAQIDALELKPDALKDEMPFNAAVKGYSGAIDNHGHPWILKPVESEEEARFHRTCALAYLIDHATGTLAAPTSVCRMNGRIFRIAKVVRKSVQISSYDYLDRPYIEILRADLVNRWLFFDEDRNPNNYLVIHNAKGRPFVVAIDYDKSDLASEVMKITGNPDKFGWFRLEKTRFLTLLKPSNFEGVSIDAFDSRLKAVCALGESWLKSLSRSTLSGYADQAYADLICANILKRRAYIDEYFRRMFKAASDTADIRHGEDYAAFGDSFGNIYKNKN